MASCPLCGQRKAKRACPAKRVDICPHCCGTKRRIEIDCPADCVYLKGEHAQGWQGRQTERRRDLRRVAPHLERLDDDQARLLFLALAGINGLRAGRRGLDDHVLAQAVGAFRKTIETRARGILYEHPVEDPRAQELLLELRSLFEAKDEQGRGAAPEDRDTLAVLAALEAGLADAQRQTGGATAFLDSVTRLMGRLGGAPAPPQRPILIQP